MKIVRCEWAGVEADAWVADASGAARAASKCRVVVHAGAPRWLGGGEGEAETLRGCYRRAAEAARAAGCASAAFPLLGVWDRGIPVNVALRAAVDVLSAVEEGEGGLACVLALRPPEAEALARGAFGEVSKLLDTLSRLPPAALRAIRRVGEVLGGHSREKAEPRSAALSGGGRSSILEKLKRIAAEDSEACMAGAAPPPEADAAVPPELAARLEDIGPGVGRALMALMNRKHFDNRTLMIRTGISKQLLSKIQNGKHAKAPEKRWLLAVAVAMGLTLDETRGFLATAGYALSESNPRDVVVAYFLGKGGAQIGMVDAALACLGMETLYPDG